jgi:hypothetical protein
VQIDFDPFRVLTRAHARARGRSLTGNHGNFTVAILLLLGNYSSCKRHYEHPPSLLRLGRRA